MRVRLILFLASVLPLGAMLPGCETKGQDRFGSVALGSISAQVSCLATTTAVFGASSTFEVRLSASNQTGVKSGKVTVSGNRLSWPAITLADIPPGQCLCEVYPTATDPAGIATSPAAVFKHHFVPPFTTGGVETVIFTVSGEDTAKALAYDSWSGKKSGKTILEFAPAASALESLTLAVESHLKKQAPSISKAFKWPQAITASATALGKATK